MCTLTYPARFGEPHYLKFVPRFDCFYFYYFSRQLALRVEGPKIRYELLFSSVQFSTYLVSLPNQTVVSLLPRLKLDRAGWY